MNDKALQAIVAAEIERLSDGSPVTAAVSDGVVTLAGTVQSDQRRTLIEQELLRLPEVLDVHNHLHVDPPPGDAPTQLLALLVQQDVAPEGMDIQFSDGVMTLSGQARSWFDRDTAERLAWTLPGVRAVQNQVTLPPGAVEPDVDSAGDPMA